MPVPVPKDPEKLYPPVGRMEGQAEDTVVAELLYGGGDHGAAAARAARLAMKRYVHIFAFCAFEKETEVSLLVVNAFFALKRRIFDRNEDN